MKVLDFSSARVAKSARGKALTNIAQALALTHSYDAAAIGACASCGPAGRVGVPMYRKMPTGDVQSRVPDDHHWFADRCVDLCVADMIASETMTIPAGGEITLVVQPSKGCYFLAYGKFIAIDPATGGRPNVSIGRFRIGECAIDCRIHPVPSVAFQTDDCLGCPMPMNIGRLTDGEHFNVVITGPEGTEVTFVGHGACLPGFTCLSMCPTPVMQAP